MVSTESPERRKGPPLGSGEGREGRVHEGRLRFLIQLCAADISSSILSPQGLRASEKPQGQGKGDPWLYTWGQPPVSLG